MNLFNNILFTCLFMASYSAYAKTSDKNQPTYIEADSVEIREKEGISTYKGHVKISKGSLQIQGDLVHIISQKNAYQTFQIEGNPATFKQTNDLNEEISAQGQFIKYQSKTGILTLKKDAILIQKNNRFTSNHIIYDTQKDIVQAGQDNNGTDSEKPQRVTITIRPDPANTTKDKIESE